jgi:hypothetical protein
VEEIPRRLFYFISARQGLPGITDTLAKAKELRKIVFMKALPLKLTMKSMLVILTLVFAVAAFADAPAPCDSDGSGYTMGNLQIDFTTTSKGCTMSAHPVDVPAAYRSVTLGARGIIQIFNKYDVPNGTNSNSTATRSYFVFPRKQAPNFVPPLPGENNVKLITSSGDLIEINPGKRAGNDGTGEVLPKSMTSSDDPSFQVKESSTISKTNKGGVEISITSESQTLLLDTGFAMGGVAFTQPTKLSTFTDWRGNHCSVQNQAIFNFADYDADLKWSTDEEFFAHLKKLCPMLSLPDVQSYRDLPINLRQP